MDKSGPISSANGTAKPAKAPTRHTDTIPEREVTSPVPEECIGCKLVACITPLVISGYIRHQFKDEAAIAKAPYAQTWTGKNRWRLKYHMFNMRYTAPLVICLISYSAMFRVGPFATEQLPTPADENKRDLEIITEESSKLFLWMKTKAKENWEGASGIWSRLKNTFSHSKQSNSDEDSKSDSSVK